MTDEMKPIFIGAAIGFIVTAPIFGIRCAVLSSAITVAIWWTVYKLIP